MYEFLDEFKKTRAGLYMDNCIWNCTSKAIQFFPFDNRKKDH